MNEEREKKREGGHVEVNGVPLRSERQTLMGMSGKPMFGFHKTSMGIMAGTVSQENPSHGKGSLEGSSLAQSTDLLERRETLISLWDLLFAWVGFLASPMDSHEILQTTEFSVCSLRLRPEARQPAPGPAVSS